MSNDELISKQAAIDALGEDPKCKVRIFKTYKEGRSDQWFDDVAKISAIPSTQSKLIERAAYVRGFEQGRIQGKNDAQYYTHIDDPWAYFAERKDGELSEVEKEIKFAMWFGYTKGMKSVRDAQPEKCEDCGNFNKTRLLIPQPERTGKWKEYNADDPNWLRTDGSPVFLICSECRQVVLNNFSAHWNYCSNCGAKMEVEKNETN